MTTVLSAPTAETVPTRRKLFQQQSEIGIALCRRGDWDGGIDRLLRLKKTSSNEEWTPGLASSYLGYGLASRQKKYDEGLRYCEAAVRREVWEPDTYLNLARTHLLRKDPKRAVSALERGLQIDPDHKELLLLQNKLGRRRKLTFPLLARGHFLNRIAGKVRHGLATNRSTKGDAKTTESPTSQATSPGTRPRVVRPPAQTSHSS